MNDRIRPVLFAALLLAVSDGATGYGRDADGKPPETQTPALRVDNTPLGAEPGPVLSYADVVEPVQKAVVSITSSKEVRQPIRVNPLFRQLFPDMPDERRSTEEGLGSGVIVSPDGYILTNNHVIEGADELRVALSDGRELIARVIGSDPKTDIAVIKVDAGQLPVVTLADSDRLRVGDVVFAVGNPLGVGQAVTMGIVSAKNRNVRILEDVGGYEDFIKTDAAINMGNSGGALVDARGRLVGINSAIISPSRGNIGIGLAVPINLAAWIMNSLIETGTVARGYLGVTSEPVTPDLAEQLDLPRDTKGVVITDIVPEKAADNAGLKRTDVITAVNGHAVGSVEELRLLIAKTMPGSIAEVKVMRDGGERRFEVKLDRFDDRPDELFAGIRVKPLAAQDRSRLQMDVRVTGLLITGVAEDSPYRDVLAVNAVIMEIGRQPATDLTTARGLVQPGRNLLAIYHRGQVRFTVVTVQ
ncbi:MAG: trypsin-like peptidase domain-containing protein [Opitutus sp.]